MMSIPSGPPIRRPALFRQGALKSFQFAPRGHGYYDAFANRPDTATVSATTGPCTCIAGYSSDMIMGPGQSIGEYKLLSNDYTTHTMVPVAANFKLVLFNPGASDDVIAKTYELIEQPADGSGNTVSLHVDNITARQFHELGPVVMNTTGTADHQDANASVADRRPGRRVESIPLRGSVRFRNVTESLYVGGTVRVLRYNGSLVTGDDEQGNAKIGKNAPTVAAVMALVETIRDSPRTKVFGGDELLVTHQSNSYPADFVRSMQFECDTHFDEALYRPGYCTTCILIDNFLSSANTPANNSYEFTFQVQKAARFGPGSLLHSLQRNMLTVDHSGTTLNEQNRDAASPAGPLVGTTTRTHGRIGDYTQTAGSRHHQIQQLGV